MEVFESNRRSVCDVCEKEFPSTSKLQAHCRIHTGDKPYECEICGKSFTQSSHLGPHKRVHFDERPFGCTTWGKNFVQAEHLKAHIRIHSGERLFCCKICGTTFRAVWTLDKHHRFHTREKPYKCEVCGKRSAQKAWSLKTLLKSFRWGKKNHHLCCPNACANVSSPMVIKLTSVYTLHINYLCIYIAYKWAITELCIDLIVQCTLYVTRCTVCSIQDTVYSKWRHLPVGPSNTLGIPGRKRDGGRIPDRNVGLLRTSVPSTNFVC